MNVALLIGLTLHIWLQGPVPKAVSQRVLVDYDQKESERRRLLYLDDAELSETRLRREGLVRIRTPDIDALIESTLWSPTELEY